MIELCEKQTGIKLKGGYMRVCAICGRPRQCEHHLIFGISQRTLSTADKLCIDMCNECHNMACKPVDRIHGNTMAEKLSKMLGQAIYERDYIILNHCEGEEARNAFMARYGRNYL